MFFVGPDNLQKQYETTMVKKDHAINFRRRFEL